MKKLARGRLKHEVRFERSVRPAGHGKAGQESWVPVATVRGELLDNLPSRSEKDGGGQVIAIRRARLTIDYRTDITSDLRVVAGDRMMQIVGGPSEIGWRVGLEMVVEDYSTAGSGA